MKRAVRSWAALYARFYMLIFAARLARDTLDLLGDVMR